MSTSPCLRPSSAEQVVVSAFLYADDHLRRGGDNHTDVYNRCTAREEDSVRPVDINAGVGTPEGFLCIFPGIDLLFCVLQGRFYP